MMNETHDLLYSPMSGIVSTVEIVQLRDRIHSLEARIGLLERVYAKMMEQDLRLDTLEFNLDLPCKPAISDRLADILRRLDKLDKKEDNNDSSN